jgi:hypothetical protein
MWKKIGFVAIAAVVALLLTDSHAWAWGAAHAGYTSVGPGGVQHYGATGAAGPYGAYGSTSYGNRYGGGGSYAGVGPGGVSAGTYSYGGGHYSAQQTSPFGGITSTYGGGASMVTYK